MPLASCLINLQMRLIRVKGDKFNRYKTAETASEISVRLLTKRVFLFCM
jgi:hypothetical protein